ncbi:MAG: NUDIX domain-containing protein [Porphyrobacter sp.]|nr:NUDIX domain-containing protein [Porphyrobacter sp.]
MPHWLPAPVHRAALPLAHELRHRWRRWRKAPIAGSSVILTNSAGEVLLLRHSYGPPVWALPGGGLARDEDPLEGARREVFEELGLTLGDMVPIAVIEEVISGSPHTAHVFAATTAAAPRPDGREIIAAQFFAPDALPPDIGRTTAARLAIWQEWRALQQG